MSLTLRPTSRILSSFVGDRFLHSTPPLHQLFRYNPGPVSKPKTQNKTKKILQFIVMVMLGVIAGSKHVSMQLSRTFSGLSDLLFNRRCVCVICYISFLCTQTQGVHINLIILENRFMLLIEYIHLEFMFAFLVVFLYSFTYQKLTFG